MNNSSVTSFLQQLGLSKNQTHLYLTLLESGPATTLELARKSAINRTRVYRELERMREKGLIDQIIDEHRKLHQAIDPDHLTPLVNAQLEQAQTLAHRFPDVKTYLLQQIHRRGPDTKVYFYKGKTGICQMLWRVLRTKKELVGYTYRTLKSITGEKFTQDFYQEIMDHRIKIRDIYSDEYIESAGGIAQAVKGTAEGIAGWEHLVSSRYLSPAVLDVNCQMDIYNNVVSYYNWHEGEVFGVEIENDKIARLQKQIFEILWTQALPEEKLLKGKR